MFFLIFSLFEEMFLFDFFWFKSKLYRFRRICFNFVQYSICWHTQNNQSVEQMIYSEKKIIMKFWLCETVRLQIRTQIKSQSYDIKREKSKDCFGSIWEKKGDCWCWCANNTRDAVCSNLECTRRQRSTLSKRINTPSFYWILSVWQDRSLTTTDCFINVETLNPI